MIILQTRKVDEHTMHILIDKARVERMYKKVDSLENNLNFKSQKVRSIKYEIL